MQEEQCFYKMEQYVGMIAKSSDEDIKRKLVGLAVEYMLRCRQLGQAFQNRIFDHLYSMIVKYKDYVLLLLLDQLIRQFKEIKRQAKEDIDTLFSNIFSQCLRERKERAIRDLKVVWRIWTFIFGDRIRSLKSSIKNKHGIDIDDNRPEEERLIRQAMMELDPQCVVNNNATSLLSYLQSDSDQT